MSNKLTNRQLKAMSKANAKREQRLQLRAASRGGQADVAVRDHRPPRRNDWLREDGNAYDGAKMRRTRTAIARPPTTARAAPPAEATGTVIEVRSGDALVMCRGAVLRARLTSTSRIADPAARSPLAVGDRVQLQPIGPGEARIVAVEPRRSALTRDVSRAGRRNAPHIGHVLAANIGQVVVVCSPAAPPFRPRLIDRYLVAASRDALPVVICLNKTDLGLSAEVDASLQGYRALGIPVLRCSALSGDGIEEVQASITGSVSLFTGHSGVGKSSLLNALEPGLALQVGEVAQSTAGQGRGRHTTSSARLIPLSLPDTFVVDTPGIRAFGIRGLDPRELAGHFPDLAALADGCAYRDCLHRNEPECAVAARAQDEPFLHQRLQSYRLMLVGLR